MSDDPHLPTPLAHGRWAGDRVGRSAREAGASLKTLSKRATLTEQQRHRLGSGSFEWRQPEKQRSQRGGLFWTVFPRGAVQNGAQLDRIAARESEDLLFNTHTSPAMCVELTGGPPVRWFVIQCRSVLQQYKNPTQNSLWLSMPRGHRSNKLHTLSLRRAVRF